MLAKAFHSHSFVFSFAILAKRIITISVNNVAVMPRIYNNK